MSATTACIRPARPRPNYDAYLREQGYEATNPWEHWANSGAADDGALQNGWLLVACRQGGARRRKRIPRRPT